MKQYRITSENLSQDTSEDAYLSPDDPIHLLKAAHYLGGLGSEAKLAEYRATQARHNLEINKDSNIISGSDKRRLERENNIQPGTDEWFKLWFGKNNGGITT